MIPAILDKSLMIGKYNEWSQTLRDLKNSKPQRTELFLVLFSFAFRIPFTGS